MSRLWVAVLLMTTALIGAPLAVGDPEDLMPYCSGGQTPANNNCRPSSDQTYDDDAPGANPGVPVGVDPVHTPAV